MIAWTFAIKSLDTGALKAHALVAADARYISLQWVHDARLDRRFATAEQWREILHELSVGLAAGPLPDASVLRRVLSGSAGWSVQYVTRNDVDVPTHAGGAPQLDAALRAEHSTFVAPSLRLVGCRGCREGWVCEEHEDQPMGHDDCGAAGMPCGDCQATDGKPVVNWDQLIVSPDD